MNITILCDNPQSWILPFAVELETELTKRKHAVRLVHDAKDVGKGDIAFFLGCENVVPKSIRARNMHNLVVHESALPHGKGWSPLTWQILEGKNDIPITLLEAAESVDAGDVYAVDTMHFEGHELVDELREAQGKATIALALRFVDAKGSLPPKKQTGKGSVYAKRTPKDSEINPSKTLTELFDQLRVADNERYPAFFKHRGHTYVLKIYKKKALKK